MRKTLKRCEKNIILAWSNAFNRIQAIDCVLYIEASVQNIGFLLVHSLVISTGKQKRRRGKSDECEENLL